MFIHVVQQLCSIETLMNPVKTLQVLLVLVLIRDWLFWLYSRDRLWHVLMQFLKEPNEYVYFVQLVIFPIIEIDKFEINLI